MGNDWEEKIEWEHGWKIVRNWLGNDWKNGFEMIGKIIGKRLGRWLGNEREMIANRSEDGWNVLYKQFLNGGCIGGYTTLVGKSVLDI